MARKGGSGGNTKVEAANARKAAAKSAKDAQAAAKAAESEAAEWSKGANNRAEQRRAEQEAKRAEAEARKAELQKIQALEEHALQEDKTAIRKLKKDKAPVAKPWEEALKPVVKKSNKGSRAASAASGKVTQAQLAAMREEEERRAAASRAPVKKEIQFNSNFTENRNRAVDGGDEARSIEAALDVLTVGDKDLERHPERRAKAAYKAFEEVMMPQLREDYPGLKLSQYKQKLSELVRFLRLFACDYGFGCPSNVVPRVCDDALIAFCSGESRRRTRSTRRAWRTTPRSRCTSRLCEGGMQRERL